MRRSLYHVAGVQKGYTWKKHKYIKKVKTKSGRWRYIYTGASASVDPVTYNADEELYEIQQLPDGPEKERAMKIWHKKKEQMDEIAKGMQGLYQSGGGKGIYHSGLSRIKRTG